MPAWKNITLDIPKGDLNSISEKISEIKRVLSITITDKIDEPNSKWFDEGGKQQPLLYTFREKIYLASAPTV